MSVKSNLSTCGHTMLNTTVPHLNTEVKQRQAGLVLGWETAWESPVLQAFFFGECFDKKKHFFNYNVLHMLYKKTTKECI